MTNKKRKGFTIVELVIVIAVIAILAGVLIPTFASIIDKANQSSDIQAVRQMNVVLMAESVENEPTGIGDVINIVAEAGYDTEEKLTPKSNNHGFYWYSEANVIALVKGDSELIFPEDNAALNGIFGQEGFTLSGNNAFFNLLDNIDAVGGGAGEEIMNAEELKAALEAGGEIKLGADIIINEPITISGGTSEAPLVINLNNHTLTLDASASVVITGYVVFDGATESTLSELSGGANSEDSGSATRYSKKSTSANLMECDNETLTSSIIINDDGAYYNEQGFGSEGYDSPDYPILATPGFKVKGSLTISNLAIDGNRFCNIDNEGTATINNVDFEVTPAIILYKGAPYSCLSYGIFNRGEVSFENVNYNENEVLDTNLAYAYAYGIHNEGTITSILNSSFTVSGGYGIVNKGPATINNTTFYVNCGTGFYNEHTITSVDDTVTITGGSFIARGTDVTSVYNYSGTMTISGSTFSESKEGVEVSYSNSAPIYNETSDALLTLTDVNINSSANYYVYTASGEVTINGGIYGDTSTTGLFSCLSDGIVTINKGTTDGKMFSLNGKGFDAVFDLGSPNPESPNPESPKSYLTYGAHVSTILISNGTTKTIMLNNGRDNLKVLASKFEGQKIPEGCVVTIYLDTQTTDIDVDIQVEGTLTLNGLGDGGISHLRNESGSITLLEKGCLYFNSIGKYEHNPDNFDDNKDQLIAKCIDYKTYECTFKINGEAYSPPLNQTE